MLMFCYLSQGTIHVRLFDYLPWRIRSAAHVAVHAQGQVDAARPDGRRGRTQAHLLSGPTQHVQGESRVRRPTAHRSQCALRRAQVRRLDGARGLGLHARRLHLHQGRGSLGGNGSSLKQCCCLKDIEHRSSLYMYQQNDCKFVSARDVTVIERTGSELNFVVKYNFIIIIIILTIYVMKHNKQKTNICSFILVD